MPVNEAAPPPSRLSDWALANYAVALIAKAAKAVLKFISSFLPKLVQPRESVIPSRAIKICIEVFDMPISVFGSVEPRSKIFRPLANAAC